MRGCVYFMKQVWLVEKTRRFVAIAVTNAETNSWHVELGVLEALVSENARYQANMHKMTVCC